ncbi:cold shock domain-containing protein [Micromonospora profundi]|uniref:Cold shock domain-containing protein n=1 Tax=Micromonospora profundi TaxID=1420889 RepID=A0AAJ6I140_9ACTN|nr:cold shock domain-containing protein [Micromonospora profundi]WLS48863.1 cold shock domain-containing protein [Micromonospora profundi]
MVSPAASKSTDQVLTGRVKWWNEVEGFGFLIPDLPGQDLFVHSSMLAPGCVGLEEGQRVSFKIVQLSKGPGAEEVRPL